MGQKKKRSHLKKEACLLCGSDEENEVLYGKLHQNKEFSIHQNCMFLSSGLAQRGTRESEGILGFLAKDIKEEYARGQKLKCCYCKKEGATLGCIINNCKKSFHYPCGVKNRVLNQHFGDFSSYCHIHKLKQKHISIKEEMYCYICCTALTDDDLEDCLYSPCCKNNWFHHCCLQKYAISAGLHFFKCPLCNNTSTFVEEMKKFGICIPNKDASWELESNAFNELLYRPECGASPCSCHRGRKHDGKGAWSLLACAVCGADARHKHCANLRKSEEKWKCDDCKAFESEKIKNEVAVIDNSIIIEDAALPCNKTVLGTTLDCNNETTMSADEAIQHINDETTMSADEAIQHINDETTMSADEAIQHINDESGSLQSGKSVLVANSDDKAKKGEINIGEDNSLHCNKSICVASSSSDNKTSMSADKNIEITLKENNALRYDESISAAISNCDYEIKQAVEKIEIRKKETTSVVKDESFPKLKYSLRSFSIVLNKIEIDAELKKTKAKHSDTKEVLSRSIKSRDSLKSKADSTLSSETTLNIEVKSVNITIACDDNELEGTHLSPKTENIPLKAEKSGKVLTQIPAKDLKAQVITTTIKNKLRHNKKCLTDRNVIEDTKDSNRQSPVVSLSLKRSAQKDLKHAKSKRQKTIKSGCCSGGSNHCIKKMFGISCENC